MHRGIASEWLPPIIYEQHREGRSEFTSIRECRSNETRYTGNGKSDELHSYRGAQLNRWFNHFRWTWRSSAESESAWIASAKTRTHEYQIVSSLPLCAAAFKQRTGTLFSWIPMNARPGGFARARRSLTALWRQWNNRAVTETRGTNWWQIICVHAPWQDAASAEINYSFIALGGEGNADGKTMSRTVKSMMTTTLLKTAWQALFIVWYKYHCNKRMHDLEIKNTPPGWRNNDFSEST